MPENIVDLIDKIRAVRGQDYANGLVDMANLLVPNNEPGKVLSEANAANPNTDSIGTRCVADMAATAPQ